MSSDVAPKELSAPQHKNLAKNWSHLHSRSELELTRQNTLLPELRNTRERPDQGLTTLAVAVIQVSGRPPDM